MGIGVGDVANPHVRVGDEPSGVLGGQRELHRTAYDRGMLDLRLQLIKMRTECVRCARRLLARANSVPAACLRRARQRPTLPLFPDTDAVTLLGAPRSALWLVTCACVLRAPPPVATAPARAAT